MAGSPSTTEGNGRGARGRFAAGNRFAVGNPHAAKVAKLRSAALAAVSAKDLRGIIRRLVADALAGDVAASREVLSRVLGPYEATDALRELAALREIVNDLLQRAGFPCETN